MKESMTSIYIEPINYKFQINKDILKSNKKYQKNDETIPLNSLPNSNLFLKSINDSSFCHNA